LAGPRCSTGWPGGNGPPWRSRPGDVGATPRRGSAPGGFFFLSQPTRVPGRFKAGNLARTRPARRAFQGDDLKKKPVVFRWPRFFIQPPGRGLGRHRDLFAGLLEACRKKKNGPRGPSYSMAGRVFQPIRKKQGVGSAAKTSSFRGLSFGDWWFLGRYRSHLGWEGKLSIPDALARLRWPPGCRVFPRAP